MIRKLLVLSTLLCCIALPARAADYVQAPGSTLAFGGMYQGEAFAGVFPDFTTTLSFDPADLAHPLRLHVEEAAVEGHVDVGLQTLQLFEARPEIRGGLWIAGIADERLAGDGQAAREDHVKRAPLMLDAGAPARAALGMARRHMRGQRGAADAQALAIGDHAVDLDRGKSNESR